MTSSGTYSNLHDRKFGLSSGAKFSRSLVSNFFEALRPCLIDEVSKYKDAAITSLDIDFSENRYLLSGNNDGCIALHDVNGPDSLENSVKLLAVLGNRNRTPNNAGNVSSYICREDAHKEATTRVNWWPADNGMFTSSSVDGKLKIWDTNALSVAAEYDARTEVFSHAAAKTANIVALAGQGVVLYDLNSGSGFQKLDTKDRKVLDVHWLVDCDRYLLACSPDGGLVVYDVRKYEVVLPLIDSARNSSVFFCREMEGNDIRKCRTKSTFHYRPISARLTQDGQSVVCVCADGTVLHFLLFEGRLVAERKSRSWIKYSGFTFQLASPRLLNGSLIFIPNGSSELQVYNCDTRQMISLPHAHFKGALCCAVNEVNLKLFSAGYDRRILTFASPNRCCRLRDGTFDETAVDDVSDWDAELCEGRP